MSNNDYNNIEPYTIEELPELPAGTEPAPEYSSDVFEDTTTTSTRKFPFFLVIVALVVVGLVAFGFLLLNAINNGSDPETPNNNGNNGNVDQSIILIWRGVFLDNDVIQPLIDEYESLNSNIQIQYSNEWPLQQPFGQALRSYQLQLNQDLEDTIDAADIFMVHNSWVEDYENVSAPSTTFTAQSFINTFYPAAATDLIANGQVYGAPLWMDTYAVVYNKDMLAAIQKSQPEESWNEFQNTAEDLTSFSGNTLEQSGFAFGFGSNIDFAFEMLHVLMRQNGVSLVNTEGLPAFAQDANTLDAFNFFLGFANGTDRTWNNSFTNASAAFLEERAAMIIVPSWRLREILKFNDDRGLGIDIGISQLPQFTSQDKEIINWVDYWPMIVNNKRNNSIAAWSFISWLTEPDQLRKLNENIENSEGYFGNLYPRQDMSTDLQDNEYLSIYNRSLPFAESWKMIKGREIRALFVEILSRSSVSANQIASLEEDIRELMALKGQRDTLETQN